MTAALKTEEKPAHTPGPWSIDTCGDPIIINGPEDGRAIVAWVPSAQDNPDEDWSPEELANARLIAAAPALAEALREILAECGDVPAGLSEAALGVIAIRAHNALRAGGAA